ncbi:prenyltransferase [Rubripirellula lacrimiformis]|uniref:Prenyltransferase n=1 Tax=Rubripirellula lacrimiformis TaxID=1930273 RepID=A0A517N7B5_9BACT|nr:UbiA family prenyltransferase [Rubripirellula lacrimiformis]QDT03021.1 prenyltransferase [Rubripirellula lacrimiformis]
MAASNTSSPNSALYDWAQLVRLPNVFTVLADVGAAFLLVAGGPQPVARLVAVILAGVCLYWAGMILNDVFDVEKDKAERSSRPLAAGRIGLGKARMAGWALLLLGIIIAAVSGYLPAQDRPTTWVPGVIAIALAGMIVAYDGPLKKTPAAPAAMGGCRVLSFLLGASPCMVMAADEPLFPKYVLGAACGFGVYIMGITTMGRREAVGGPSHHLPTGFLVTCFGFILLATAPWLAPPEDQVVLLDWDPAVVRMFPLLIAMIAFPVVIRAFRAVRSPSPAHIQMAIRVGILSMIPLAAAYAYLGAGQVWAMVIFALVVPSLLLAARFRVT